MQHSETALETGILTARLTLYIFWKLLYSGKTISAQLWHLVGF